MGIFWAQAQTANGRIHGVIRHALHGDRIAGATIQLQPLDQHANSGTQGEFDFSRLSDGAYALTIAYMGFETQTLSEIQVKNQETISIEIDLMPEDTKIAEVQVVGTRRRGNEIALLAEQQRSFTITQKIGTQELSRKGLGDAAAAVSKISGIAHAGDLRQTIVRGLGDRYNTTSLNHLPLPSNDPEFKNMALDLFDASIIEFVQVDKTYQSSFQGDFGGAHIGIQSKEFRDRSLFELKVGSSLNAQALNKSGDFLRYAGGNWTGFSSYDLPKNYTKEFNFPHSMNPKAGMNGFPGSAQVIAGRSVNLQDGGVLRLFGTAKFNSSFEQFDGVQRAINAQGARLLDLDQTQYAYLAQTTGLFNAQYVHPNQHKIAYHALLVNNHQQKSDVYTGFIRDIAEEDNGRLQRATQTQTKLWVHQLTGQYVLNDRLTLDGGLALNQVHNWMPDRMQNTFRQGADANTYTFVQNTITDNHRYFQRLKEVEYAWNVQGIYQLDAEHVGANQLIVGYQGRMIDRNFEALQYNFRMNSNALNTAVDPLNLDAFFNENRFQDQGFRVETFAGETPQTYAGEQHIHSAFANWKKSTEAWSWDLGMRFESIDQQVNWRTQLDPESNSNDLVKQAILPSLHVTRKLSERQNLRFALSKTYTLPQFKERALFVYEDIPDKKRGNPDLYASDNYNIDLKWEYFPNPGEILSIGAFGKYIQNPINETTIASSSNDISFVNTGDVGTVLGVEWEFRKQLPFNFSERNKLSLGFNGAYMRTDQELDSEKVARETALKLNLTHDKASFTGASDLLLNADISYTRTQASGQQFSAAAVYAYSSDYIYSLGVEGRGNLVNKGVHQMDLVFTNQFSQKFSLEMAVKNVLNPMYKRVQDNGQGEIPVMHYRKGQFFSLSMAYKF